MLFVEPLGFVNHAPDRARNTAVRIERHIDHKEPTPPELLAKYAGQANRGFRTHDDKRIECNGCPVHDFCSGVDEIADIRFTTSKENASFLTSGSLAIENPILTSARLIIKYNPEVGSKIFLIVVDEGAICRLCVDGTIHKPCGRSHKHRFGTPECPRQNLDRFVEDRPDLSGRKVAELFAEFCTLSVITHRGIFTPPAEEEGAT